MSFSILNFQFSIQKGGLAYEYRTRDRSNREKVVEPDDSL